MMAEPLNCDYGCEDVHDDRCELAELGWTKAEFVSAIEGCAAAAIDTYLFLMDEGDSAEQAKEISVEEAIEAATCAAGIGSCGGGGCLHG